MSKDKLQTVGGSPVGNNQNSLTFTDLGPMALQDVWYLEKMAHFDREVIPERRMHAKGSGAYGTFTVTHDISRYSKADLFSCIGKQTDVFMRFSTVAGERGAADAERDIRGFAIKFYTQQGNWDLVGNNTPVFFLRDPLKFPDLNHAVKRDPFTNMRSAQNNWDFWTSLPEALQQVTITMSDMGIPLSYRFMNGFGSHTFSMINKNDNLVWVKFHFRTQQGLKYLTDNQAQKIIAKDRESSQRDLLNAIENGSYPKWKMYIQVMTQQQAKTHRDNPFDLTKTWSEKQYPLIPVGTLELNRNPDNYFAEVEQAAFNPASVVPGISFSPDKMLQGRLFSYGDAQRYRLGVNHHLIPVNSPKAMENPPKYYHRDGQMRTDDNFGRTIGYNPNSYGIWDESKKYADLPQHYCGEMDRFNPYDAPNDDVYYQAGDLYREMDECEKERLIENTKNSIMPTTSNIKYRHAVNCYHADEDYGMRIAKSLGLNINYMLLLATKTKQELLLATALYIQE